MSHWSDLRSFPLLPSGLVRKPANFISSISDDRGDELRYAGMKISEIFSEDLGVGGVLSLLWFRRRLPAFATKFIEMVLMVTADHGPAVSGAHNTIVTARAGKVRLPGPPQSTRFLHLVLISSALFCCCRTWSPRWPPVC